MDPDLANDAVQFMELQVTLMTCLLLFFIKNNWCVCVRLWVGG